MEGGNPSAGSAGRYSPGICIGAQKTEVMGKPNPDLISTSYVERSNLTLRMQQRRFTRLTNAFSKKAMNHAHAVSLYFMFYNCCRAAMAAQLMDHVWSVEEILDKMTPTYSLQSS